MSTYDFNKNRLYVSSARVCVCVHSTNMIVQMGNSMWELSPKTKYI